MSEFLLQRTSLKEQLEPCLPQLKEKRGCGDVHPGQPLTLIGNYAINAPSDLDESVLMPWLNR